ncbi:ankyrin repeat domain-containing protein 2A-like [Contarinia nasturtii]|uniref:ankyrin repeat domain-containing protein 2A-like n=1 Tax=Contarinia nasturtii TaxID=265458 RepID=UPI0012D487FF|nr:ankyrin repeat domain-containing protein 2A-like [Contarinia nasturtii]
MKFFIVLIVLCAFTSVISALPKISKAERANDDFWDVVAEKAEHNIFEGLFDMILFGITGGKGRDETTRLHVAARRGNLKQVKDEIDYDEDVDAVDFRGNTALHEAILNGNANVVKLLLENDADITVENDDGKTPIDVALEQGRDKIHKMLLKAEESEIEDRQLRLKYLKKALF